MGEHGSCFATSAPAPVISFLDVPFVLFVERHKKGTISITPLASSIYLPSCEHCKLLCVTDAFEF